MIYEQGRKERGQGSERAKSKVSRAREEGGGEREKTEDCERDRGVRENELGKDGRGGVRQRLREG